MLKLVHIVSFAGALAALSSTASAQPAARGMAACRVDLATFCQGLEAGRGRRVACLIQNQAKLSPDCQAAIQQRAARMPAGAPFPGAVPPAGASPPAANAPATAPPSAPPAAAFPATPPAPVLKSAIPARGGKGGGRFAACRADMQVLCAAAPAGGGGRMRCLQDNQAKLSPACADTLAQLKGLKQEARMACAPDAKRLCPGLRGEQRRACFADNQAQLSPECAAVAGKRASAGGAVKRQ